jgi:hypothetical protein
MIMLNQMMALNAQFMMPSGPDLLSLSYLEALLFVHLQQARAPKTCLFFIYLTYKLCCSELKRKFVKHKTTGDSRKK